MNVFWIIGAIISYIGIGVCVSAWNIRTSGNSDWCVVFAFLWPLYFVAWVVYYVVRVVLIVWFAIKWVVLRLAGKEYSWKEFKEFVDD